MNEVFGKSYRLRKKRNTFSAPQRIQRERRSRARIKSLLPDPCMTKCAFRASTSRERRLSHEPAHSEFAFLRVSVSPWWVLDRPRQPQLRRDPFHGLNAERDVLFQIDAEVGSAVDDVVA